MKLSFIILNYKSPHHLRICLEHIGRLALPFDHEVIVVDNASNDESVPMVRKHFPDVILIESNTNTGHTRGNNLGIAKASGEYVLITNPDILYRDGSDIAGMIQYMDENAKTAILGPKLLNPDGTVQNSCYRKYTTLTPMYRRTFVGKLPWGRRNIEQHLMSDFHHDSTISVDWILGASMCIRTSVLKQIGAFNEAFFLYFGDYELCDRARQAGFDVIYYHDTRGIVHYHKRESVTSRFTLIQTVSYVTRIHIMDWLQYLKISRKK